VAWAFDLGFSYAVTPHACSTGHFYVLHIISLICFVVALTGFVLAFGTQRKMPERADKQGHAPRDRAFFPKDLKGTIESGIAGLRPTYGRVPRTGAMTLCWSLDKLGPMARYVEGRGREGR
jgi:hypothetical protein